MEIVEDFESFSPTKAPSSPAPEKRLKRLKKAQSLLQSSISLDCLDSEKSNIGRSEELDLETLDVEKSNSEDLEEPVFGFKFRSDSEAFVDENGLNTGAGGLDSGEHEPGAKRALDLDSVVEGLDGRSEDRLDVEMEKDAEDSRVVESEKKRPSSARSEEKKRKKSRVKDVSDDDKPKLAALPKRRADKERREYLRQLRAESQRLLRDTRDAAFKSAPLVQKPISSVLEKIRQRKLEVSKKSFNLSKTSLMDYEDEESPRDVMISSQLKTAPAEEIKDDEITKVSSEEAILPPADGKSSLGMFCEHEPKNTPNHSSHEDLPAQMDLDEEPKQAFRAPIDDTQDLFSDSQTGESKDELPNESPNSPHDVAAPSVLAMNLKLDSAPPDDISSDEEEDNDKENHDPRSCDWDQLSSSPNGDPLKAFLDDEAEEEDDSDNDLLRFQDNEEDEENDDAEELKDMIATQYEEKTIDIEKRNELHQKWLEQQDSARTEKLLQRYKCGSNQMEETLLDEDEMEESEENEYGDEAAEDAIPTNMRMNLKKVKEMIPQMFTDKEDPYVSSDDEETEQSLVKQRFFEKSERRGTFWSPAEDKDSREVFGLIKKLNIVPDTRKKAKTSALADMQLIGGKRTASSKSSFLGRASNHSLPSSHKHGSSVVRSFIFERDESRRAVPVSEGSSNMVQEENRPARITSTKVLSSQVRSTTQTTKPAAETNSGTALLEILRRSSVQSGHCTQDAAVSHTESVLATFKVEKTVRKERNISIRTL